MGTHNFNKIKDKLIFLTLFITILLTQISFVSSAHSSQINDVSVIINNNELFVTTSLTPESKFIEDILGGISKEIIIYIDLFRVWKIWPDEFVRGKKITRILKSDPIKREYYALNFDGNIRTEKRFKDSDSMISWAFNISDYRLTNIKDLDTGKYFVKVTIESHIKHLPPLLGYFLFFIPEKEFSLSKNSIKFMIPFDSPNK